MVRFQRTVPAPVNPARNSDISCRFHVRKDFEHCCAYCLRHEDWAEPETFELDHFYPKSLFPEKQYDFYNLYYACSRCNSFKWNHFPSARLASQGIEFIDFCRDDFERHYEISASGIWEPRTLSAKYMIDTLNLNSNHLVRQRLFLARIGYDIEKPNPEQIIAVTLED